MSDPIDELSNFEPGVSVSPIPAAEVRRRGDRLRRRRTALAVGGAVAAVLLIAVPVAVVAGDDDGGTPQPADDPVGTSDVLSADELPARDGLTPWTETPTEGKTLACQPAPPAALDADSWLRRDFRAETAGAPASETPAAAVHVEVLQFADEETARHEYDQAQGWVFGCPGGGEDLAVKGVAATTYELEGGRGEWILHEFYYRGCGECDGIVFNRMGVAQFDDRVVLVSLAEIGGPLEPEGLEKSMNELYDAAVTKAGGVITGAGSTGEVETPTPDVPALADVLETGLSEPDGVEVTREGPGPQAPGAEEVSPCDQEVWPADVRDRIAVTETGPGYAESREAVEFATVDGAVAAMAALRSAVSACPTEVNEFDPTNSPEMAWTVEQADTGYEDSVTFAQTYLDGMPGGSIWQFTRVGRGILATYVGGEITAGRSVTRAVENMTEVTRTITPAMCMYTEEGC